MLLAYAPAMLPNKQVTTIDPLRIVLLSINKKLGRGEEKERRRRRRRRDGNPTLLSPTLLSPTSYLVAEHEERAW